MSNNSPELLAPAGDLEKLKAAVTFGADAVYLGAKSFGMRASVSNFSPEELRNAVDYAHQNGVKVYLTCNTLPTNDEVDQLEDFLKDAKNASVDALIVSDIGILGFVKRTMPEMEIHISTQAGVVNYLTANELYHLGANRVVLARELSLEQIQIIRHKTNPDLEIEAFVHGAMCMSFSGRCLLSQYMTGRDANRGECAQPCRWGYHLVEEKRPGEYYPLYEDEKGSYILNAKDLCMIEHIDALTKAGISSFKIEGRAKSSYYVAVICNAYRIALDLYRQNPNGFVLPTWLVDEVRKVSHRDYSTGFFYGRPEEGQCYENAGYIRSWDIVALVEGYQDGMLICSEKNRFMAGDELELLEPGKKPVTVTVNRMLDTDNGELTVACHPQMVVKIPYDRPVCAGAMLRKARQE